MSAAVGADVESLCSKCGDVWHVVVAKVGDQIVRVLESHRQSKEVRRRQGSRSFDGRAMLDEALGPPQARRLSEQLEAGRDRATRKRLYEYPHLDLAHVQAIRRAVAVGLGIEPGLWT